jgi:hypothetical protein
MDRDSDYVALPGGEESDDDNSSDDQEENLSHFTEQSHLYDNETMVDLKEKWHEGAPKEEKQFTLLRKKAIAYNVIAVMLVILLNLLYFNSLGTCPYSYDDPNVCIAYFRKQYPVWLGETIVVGILWTAVALMAIYKYISRYWIIFLFADFIALFLAKSGMEMKDHGGINRTVLAISISVLFLVYGIYRGLTNLWKYSKKIFIGLFASLFMLAVIFYRVRVVHSCANWEYGLGGHKIINDESVCKVPIPTFCELGIRNNWFDFSRFTSPCNKKKTFLDTSKLPLPLQKNPNLKRVGFPRIENFPDHVKVNQTLYRQHLRERIVDMDDPTLSSRIKNNIEYVVDMSNPEHHKLNIELKPNMTRAKEQQKLREKIIQQEKLDGTYANRIDKNMLIIYIDNLSRAHFYRKMPLTAKWLEQFIDNQDGDYSTYQFFRYHSVYYNTLYSNDAMYYGEVEDVDDTRNNVFDSYSKNGYVTGFFKDSCETNANSIHDPNPHLHKWDHFGGEIT